MRKTIHLLILASLLIAILSGCGAKKTESINLPVVSGGGRYPTPQWTAFQITKPDGNTVNFTYEELRKLSDVKITVEGKAEEGPLVKDVLAAAGITDFSTIQFRGEAGDAIMLTQNQVNGKVILNYSASGRVGFASSSIPKDAWVNNVILIEVQ